MSQIQECEQNTSSTLVTQALINTSHQNVSSSSEFQAKGSRRYSDPLRSLSNVHKFEPNLSVLQEISLDEANDAELLSNLKRCSLEKENKSISNQTCLSSLSTQENKSINSIEMKPQTLISSCSEAEEDIKSVNSEIFHDAEEDLLNDETVENENELKILRRRCGRDESNLSRPVLDRALDNEHTDEPDNVSKKKHTTRTVSFSKSSRRWSQLRSVNKSNSRFSRISRKLSISGAKDGLEEEVELRRKRR